MPSESSRPTSLLRRLVEEGVDFVLVGGLAAVTQGAPITTFDVDIVHERSEENIERLLRVLDAVNAHYRGHPQRLRPDSTALTGTGHNLFQTDEGPLDVLGAIDSGDDFHALQSSVVEVPFHGGTLKVLSLESLIERKRRSSHPKDRAVLPILEAALEASKE